MLVKSFIQLNASSWSSRTIHRTVGLAGGALNFKQRIPSHSRYFGFIKFHSTSTFRKANTYAIHWPQRLLVCNSCTLSPKFRRILIKLKKQAAHVRTLRLDFVGVFSLVGSFSYASTIWLDGVVTESNAFIGLSEPECIRNNVKLNEINEANISMRNWRCWNCCSYGYANATNILFMISSKTT